METAALFSLLLLSMVCRMSALSLLVTKEECVYEYVYYKGDLVSGNFVVVDNWDPNHPGIDFTVTSAGGNIVHSVKGKQEGKFEFKTSTDGMHKFCFHNPTSVPDTVSFNIHVGHIPNTHNLAKNDHLDPVNVKIAELGEKLELVTLEQKYLKARDVRHRHTNESTRNRVIFYTVGEYLSLAFVSVLQVVYVRRLFGKTVAYGRV